tara:strand:+ start:129191 stop:129925 length:735 start_codon:yes stop_codon:yes gene_type:complete
LKNTFFKACLITSALIQTSTAHANELVSDIFTGWEGDIEAGANFASGNTNKENLRFGATLNKEGEAKAWGHTVKASAHSATENNIRSEEKYRIIGQSRYNISTTNYVFGEAEYVNERLNGYQYRVSEGIGYGHKFYNTKQLRVAGEVSVGGRHSLDTQEVKENSALAKLSGKANWVINESIELAEDFSISFADSTITLSETSLKNKLSESLYLKVGVTIEHNSDVPSAKKNTDTLTSLSLGYKF